VSIAPSSLETADRWKSLTRKFAEECQRTEAGQSESAEFQKALLHSQQTGLVLFQTMGSDTNWKMIDTQARDGLAAVVKIPDRSHTSEQNTSVKLSESDLEKAVAQARQVCHAMIVLSSIRQLADLTEYQESRSVLISLSITERLSVAQLLIRQIPSNGASIPGDEPLARFLIELVNQPKDAVENVGLNVDVRLQQLRLLQTLGRAAASMAAFERALDELLRSNLSDAQLTSLMEIINSTSTPNAVKAANQAATTRRFWQTLYKRSKPGDDRWLEASLQLAILAEADGQAKESTRILAVVSVLHPNWGTPVRKAKADELRKRLEKAP
jgi:hypothetical protein